MNKEEIKEKYKEFELGRLLFPSNQRGKNTEEKNQNIGTENETEGEKMDKEVSLFNVDKILYQQLQLLAEHSKGIKTVDELVRLTEAMTKIAMHFTHN